MSIIRKTIRLLRKFLKYDVVRYARIKAGGFYSMMIVGWAINSAMILLAAATFFKSGIQVEELQQAKSLLEPLLGSNAAQSLLLQNRFGSVDACLTIISGYFVISTITEKSKLVDKFVPRLGR